MVATEWTLLESSFNGDRGEGGLRLATHGVGSRSQGATCKYEQRVLVARVAIRGMGVGVKIQKLCLKLGRGVGQPLIIAKNPIETNYLPIIALLKDILSIFYSCRGNFSKTKPTKRV